ncbi:hypothetical protein [Alteromonas sp. 009811495]|uniref:hypothetical protein n=1 Tax=Alteromonas sp. 009811495 TaxID=3002962 RepID=UPI00237EAC0D|nr:hypothetical protein [Alteromonas sp. 009811495]WDT85939.1 hypothetical protein OZ660_18710 [Alteromonas sp. 009811495]
MSIEHQFKKLRNPAFAHSFADLMMGAMGIIIVLLTFLKIVEIKGQGSVTADSELTLPPGLRDLNAHPLVRLRLISCGSTIESISNDLAMKIETMPVEVLTTARQNPLVSTGRIGDCIVQTLVFPQGLQGAPLQLSAIEYSEYPINFIFNIGGFALQERLQPFHGDAGIVAVINPENRNIIEIR